MPVYYFDYIDSFSKGTLQSRKLAVVCIIDSKSDRFEKKQGPFR